MATSQYGLDGLSKFRNWLNTGKIAPLVAESEVTKKIAKKYGLKEGTLNGSVYKLFSRLRQLYVSDILLH